VEAHFNSSTFKQYSHLRKLIEEGKKKLPHITSLGKDLKDMAGKVADHAPNNIRSNNMKIYLELAIGSGDGVERRSLEHFLDHSHSHIQDSLIIKDWQVYQGLVRSDILPYKLSITLDTDRESAGESQQSFGEMVKSLNGLVDASTDSVKVFKKHAKIDEIDKTNSSIKKALDLVRRGADGLDVTPDDISDMDSLLKENKAIKKKVKTNSKLDPVATGFKMLLENGELGTTLASVTNLLEFHKEHQSSFWFSRLLKLNNVKSRNVWVKLSDDDNTEDRVVILKDEKEISQLSKDKDSYFLIRIDTEIVQIEKVADIQI